MEKHYNKHYIKVDERGRIVKAWSDGPFPDEDTTGAIRINERGGYQFRLTPGGEENPLLFDRRGVALYRWEDGKAVARSQDELEADRASIPAPGPTVQEQLRADVDFLAAMQGVSL